MVDSINHNFARIRNDSYNSFLLNKKMTFDNVRIRIKSVVNKMNTAILYF